MPTFEWKEAPRATFAVIGDPVSHSLSPIMQSAALRALGLDESYVAIRVAPGEVRTALDHLKALGYAGVNCTVPHKLEAFSCTEPDETSRRIGAVNTIDLITNRSTNTDSPGFLASLQIEKVNLEGRILLIGAGGTARAIVHGLAGLDLNLCGYNRTRAKLEAIRSELCPSLEILDQPNLSEFDVVIDATSASALKGSFPIPITPAKRGAVFYSLMYDRDSNSQASTPLLQSAQEAGFRPLDGRTLLAAQGTLSVKFWHPEVAEAQLKVVQTAMREAIGLPGASLD